MTIRIRSLSEPWPMARDRAPGVDASTCLMHGLAGLAGIAFIALLSLPAARGVSETFGWMPLWLLALPTAAWLAVRLAHGRGASAPGTASRERRGPSLPVRRPARTATSRLRAAGRRAA